MNEPGERVRVDRWVWAARFVKSRALAADAVKAGRVQVNGERVKPSRGLKPGDELQVTLGAVRRTVVVRGLSERRGPASEAALLYEETAQSVAARELQSDRSGRPTKRDRRRLDGFGGHR
jgi:ribosome-associated heat shock protein Hsp15